MLDKNGMEYEIEENIIIPDVEQDAKKFTLELLIKENAGSDPFWEECLTDFFNNVNKTEDEKIEFLKKLSLEQHLFNEFTKEIVRISNADKLFEKYNKLLNKNEKVVEKITDQELKKIVEEVIGNNDPYWNEPVYEIVKKIMSLPSGTETTIIKLLDSSQYTSNQLFDIYLCVTKVCIKIGIVLKFHKDNAKVDGLLYKLPFFIKRILKCPNCGEKLSYLMPSGSYLHCDKCNKYYKYDNGNVGTETETPYNRNDVMY